MGLGEGCPRGPTQPVEDDAPAVLFPCLPSAGPQPRAAPSAVSLAAGAGCGLLGDPCLAWLIPEVLGSLGGPS